jgi:hypothetical protein
MESERLKELELVIEANRDNTTEYICAFVKAKGWEPMFDSFQDYCKTVYGWDAEVTTAVLEVAGISQ